MVKNLYREIKNSKFWIFVGVITIIKLVLMCVCSSDYQNELFFPFVMDFIENGGNVYQRFWENGITNAFPYPIAMLLIQCMGASIIRLFGVDSIILTNFLFKFPSFVVDLMGLCLLASIFEEKRRYVAVFYYASPIVIYAVYMHGQLDMLPTMFMFFAVCVLSSKRKNRYQLGVVFTALALLCKLHILAILPIVVLYLLKRDGLKKTFGYICGVTALVVAGILPFMSEGFVKSVLFNAEQSVLTQVYFSFASVQMYIPIIAVFIIYLLAFKLNFMNNELFINFCSIVFAVFLALCPPMPGWYVWIVPYIAVFFVSIDQEKYKNIAIYVLLNALYLVYFMFLHDNGYVDLYIMDKSFSFLKTGNAEVVNVFFTLLSGTLLYLVFSMYQLGVAGNSFYRRKNLPFTIGIAGDSGAGKSTMISVIEKCLGDKNLQFVEGDGDHRWERGDEYWNHYTALNPKANYLYRQADDLKVLRRGSAVRKVDYNHDTGKFTEKHRVKAKKYMILCGLHSMYLPQTRRNLDLKIYMDADETLRRYWKIQRDTSKRGYSKEAIIKQIESRVPDAEKYIYPQKKYADMVVRYYDKTLDDCMEADHEVKMSIRLTISSAANVEPLVDELIGNGLTVQYDYSDDLKSQVIDIDADDMERMHLPVEKIAERIIPQLEEITREDLNCEEINGKDGVVILFLLLMISSKMQGEM